MVARLASRARVDHQHPADAADDQPLEGWMLRVIGKGQKEREVPVPIEVVSELADYLASRGLSGMKGGSGRSLTKLFSSIHKGGLRCIAGYCINRSGVTSGSMSQALRS